MRNVTVAATQMSCTWDLTRNLNQAEELVRDAASKGAQIVLLQELFETPYFCQKEKYCYFDLSSEPENCQAIKRFQKIAEELKIVVPVSFYEKYNNIGFNSIAIIDADGSILGIYRKTHIPGGLPYSEKFYFTPGDTGFKTWKTRYARIGVGICWDQWFPEAARCMALDGAEILLYPTAIGSEPVLKRDSMPHWRNVMRGHAAANIVPVVASNRIGTEIDDDSSMTFYGSSFIADETGELVETAGKKDAEVLVHTFDLDEIAALRRNWGVYRDRRPEMYKKILTHGD